MPIPVLPNSHTPMQREIPVRTPVRLIKGVKERRELTREGTRHEPCEKVCIIFTASRSVGCAEQGVT